MRICKHETGCSPFGCEMVAWEKRCGIWTSCFFKSGIWICTYACKCMRVPSRWWYEGSSDGTLKGHHKLNIQISKVNMTKWSCCRRAVDSAQFIAQIVSILLLRYMRNATELPIYCPISEWQNGDPVCNLKGRAAKHASPAPILSYASQYFTVFQNMF